MRLPLCLLAAMVGLLTSAEPQPPQQLLEQAARGLIKLQRPDGGWDLPRDRIFRVVGVPPPPAAGDPAPVLPPAEDRYRSSAIGYSFAAEALRLVSDRVPEAFAAADRAQRLAALALLANPQNPVNLEEASAFLGAEVARSQPVVDASVRTAAETCRKVMDAKLRQGSVGDLLLGIPVPKQGGRIDLLATFWAESLLPASRHMWVPTMRTDVLQRVSRFQPLVPAVVIDRQQIIESDPTFQDGSAFAAALLLVPTDEVMIWLRSLYGDEELATIGLDRALACMRVFAKREVDGPEVWWRALADRWTTALLASAHSEVADGSAALTWESNALPVDVGNAYAIHWLLARTRIAENDRRRIVVAQEQAKRQAQAKADEAWSAVHIQDQLALLVGMQQREGSWKSDAGQPDTSALACLTFLGAGYDHITPNRYRKTVRAAVDFIKTRPIAEGSIQDQAVRTMALCEAYAMTVDRELVALCRQHTDALMHERQSHGGWADSPGTGPDWRSTTLAIMALKSGYAAGVDVPLTDLAFWWSRILGETLRDPPETLVWKSTAGVFLGRELKERSNALGTELFGRLATWTPPACEHWATTLILFHLGGDSWRAWRTRCMQLPVPKDSPAIIAMRLLADEVIHRSLLVENLPITR